MSTHLNEKGYEATLKEINKSKEKKVKKELTRNQIGNEWKRLRAFMTGKK